MNQVVAADCQTVTITGNNDNVKVGPGKFETSSVSQRSTVCRVECIGIEVGTQSSGIADSTDDS